MKFTAIACFLPFVLATGAAHAASGPLKADIGASRAEHFTLKAGSGEVHIAPSKDDAIHVELTLRQNEKSLLGLYHWMDDESTRAMQAAVLKEEQQGGNVEVSLVYPDNDTHSDIQEKWTIALPSRLAVTADMLAGQLVIKGTEGGVQASMGGGDLEIHVPRGAVRANLSGGRLSVISDTPQPGNIQVKSDFGLAILDLNGKYYGPPERHGFMSSFHFLGNTVTQKAGGTDDMELKVIGGLASLRVGSIGDVKDYRRAFEEN